jgi:hypothetical protein
VHEALQIPTEALGEKYLGLPTAVGKVLDGTFDYVADRIRIFIHSGGGGVGGGGSCLAVQAVRCLSRRTLRPSYISDELLPAPNPHL